MENAIEASLIELSKIQESKIDVLCVFGFNVLVCQQFQDWLQENRQRRLIFIEDHPEKNKPSFLSNPQIKIFFLETPLQINSIAAKIAEETVLLSLKIVDMSGSCYFTMFQKALIEMHVAASCLLSDVSDFGVRAAQHAKENSTYQSRSFLGLKNAFQGIPAIVIGAGPSLEKYQKLLPAFKEKALLFAGGSALSRIGFIPHFAAALDKEPLSCSSSMNSCFCFPPRVHPETVALMKGDLLQVPDSHLSFLNWLMGEESLFESGWTVGTFLVAMAQFLGCNPIVSVGMDYCYSDGKKYAFSEKSSKNDLVLFDGQPTQEDWVMAISWLKEFQQKHPKTRFLTATGDGISYFDSIALEDVNWKIQNHLDEKIQSRIQSLPLVQMRWDLWEESLVRVQGQLMSGESLDEEEAAYQYLLHPLWQLWKVIFQRELELDPSSLQEKMQMHQRFFFHTIIQQHLNVL